MGRSGVRRGASGEGARALSSDHYERLRAILTRAGSIHGARALLGTSADVLEDALTLGTFRRKTIERLEAAIDELEPPERERAAG
jgi:hypothetical protein